MQEIRAMVGIDVQQKQTRVLLIEDNESVALGLQWSLEYEGLAVEVVRNACDALPAVQQFQPDVVVLDLGLPDGDGRSVYERIAAHSDVPVVFSSGNDREIEISGWMCNPQTAFLLKPFSTAELLGVIQRFANS